MRKRGQQNKEMDSRYLLFGRMVPHLIRQRLNAVVALRAGSLHATAALGAVRTHVLDVDRRGDDFYVCEGELRALGDDAPIERYHRAAIVVQPVAVASLLVRVKVHAAELHGKRNRAGSSVRVGRGWGQKATIP